MTKRDPINPTDDAARTLTRTLMKAARFGALAVMDPKTRTPYVTRVAMLTHAQSILTLVSTLSTHTTALMANPACSVLIGEPTEKGDPLAHPRMTLICEATQTDKMVHKDRWLGAIPKAKLYYDFSDFVMFRLTPCDVHLNGGFGRAFRLKPDDLR